ncbi:MAG: YdcF family protein [Oligoflexia bacterium]|nr:YdcF family protein [Oligoflexia bacterium]
MFYFFSKALKILITPEFYFYVFALFMLIFVCRKKYYKYLRLTVLMFLLFFFTVTSPLSVYLYKIWITSVDGDLSPVTNVFLENEIKHLQAAVILSGDGIQKDLKSGQYFYKEAFRRFAEGLRLLQSGKVDYLIISRGNNLLLSKGLLNEGDSFISWMKDIGVFEKIKDKVLLVDDVLNTYDEAKKTTELMISKKIKNFYIVTDIHHMKRAYLIFKKQSADRGLSKEMIATAYPVITFATTDNSDNNKILWSYFLRWKVENCKYLFYVSNEILGIIAYKLKGYL